MARLAVALTAAGAVTLTGLPGLPITGASAEIIGGKRCDKKWLGKEINTPPGQIPGSGNFSELPAGLETDYSFENPSAAFDDLKEPTRAQLDKAGNTEADIKKWGKAYKKSGNPADRAMEIYARYNKQLTGPRGMQNFDDWFKVRLVGNEVNNAKGRRFEAKVVRDFNLVGPDWLCQVKVRVKDPSDPTGKKWIVRDFDAYNKNSKEFAEFKSSGEHRSDQHRAERAILKDPKYKDHRLTYVTGQKTEDGTKNAMRDLDDELKKDRGTNRTQVRVREHRSNGRANIGKPNIYTKYDPVMNPDPLKGGRGSMNSAANNSGSTPNDARRLQEAARSSGTRGAFPGGRGPGGVDFSTLELRYVGNPQPGKGIDYSFKADYVKNPDAHPSYGGKAKLQLASDAFFTWLALTPEKFWVNLNPDQPDKIMDSSFAKTDAGRVLLEADLQLKHDFFKAMDPKTDVGKRAWDSLAKRNGWPCLHSGRNWIEPAPAKVREQDGGIYILDAPLKLLTAPMDISTPGPGGGEPCKLTKAEIEHNERVLKTTVVPVVEKWINEAPEYADLRRVYTSRVAAEWVRQKDQQSPTDFRKIINSNDVKRWPLRAPNKDWTKYGVYDKYVKIFKEGEFKYELRKGQEVWVISVGGVDFSKSPKRNITKTRFDIEHPQLDKTTQRSVTDEAAYRDTSTTYLGGNGAGKLDQGPGPGPDPDPTDPDDPDPTDKPTPTPTQSNGGSGGPTGKPQEPQDPEGDLADTGSDIPVGLFAGIAAALAAAGAALIWWRRKREAATGQE